MVQLDPSKGRRGIFRVRVTTDVSFGFFPKWFPTTVLQASCSIQLCRSYPDLPDQKVEGSGLGIHMELE